MKPRHGAGVLVLVAAIGWSASARADEDADLLRGAQDAIAQGRPGDAIVRLEALGDHGIVDATVSFDRGLAYAERVRAGAEQPGDLGRAIHGFEEARELTRDPATAREATGALTLIRAEVARRRARAGEAVELDQGASIGRALAALLPENTWAFLAAALSIVLAGSWIIRARAAARARVAATTTAAISFGLLAVCTMLAAAARDTRRNVREGVVVGATTRLLDDRHVLLPGVAPLPEGLRVRLLEEGAGYSRVVASGVEGYVAESNVLPIAKRR